MTCAIFSRRNHEVVNRARVIASSRSGVSILDQKDHKLTKWIVFELDLSPLDISGIADVRIVFSDLV
ncbi:hypothetical protein YC2023_120972 [Brassica napus]